VRRLRERVAIEGVLGRERGDRDRDVEGGALFGKIRR
jgi:hypothetical protein